MKLTVLGNYGPYPPAGGACSSYFIEAGGLKILIDMGSGSLAELQKKHSLFDLDVIILTHLHFDHMGEIQLLKYAYSSAGQVKKPLLMMPDSPQDMYSQVADKRFEIHIVKDGMKCSLSGVNFDFMEVPHPFMCYAVSIAHGGSRLVFSADTSDSSALIRFAENADLFLIDACLLERDKKKASLHFTVKEACELGRTAKRTLLTHFSPRYSKDEIASEVCFGAELSEKGREYKF